MTLSDDAKKLQIEVDESVAELRQTLVRTQKELSKAKQRTEELVEATIQACKDATLALGPMKPIEGPKVDKRRKRAEVALWHLTDWQGAKVTPSYNSEIMRTRVMDFTIKATKITEIQRQDHPVNDVVICFGGDMVEGLFNYPAQLWEIDLSLYDQYITVSRLIVDVVRQALAVYNHVTVIAEWGNHGRIGNKRADVPKSDNSMVLKIFSALRSATIELFLCMAMKLVDLVLLLRPDGKQLETVGKPEHTTGTFKIYTSVITIVMRKNQCQMVLDLYIGPVQQSPITATQETLWPPQVFLLKDSTSLIPNEVVSLLVIKFG